jgi:hypothetical protein
MIPLAMINRNVAGMSVRTTRVTTNFVLNLYPRILLRLSKWSFTRLLLTKNISVSSGMTVNGNNRRTITRVKTGTPSRVI